MPAASGTPSWMRQKPARGVGRGGRGALPGRFSYLGTGEAPGAGKVPKKRPGVGRRGSRGPTRQGEGRTALPLRDRGDRVDATPASFAPATSGGWTRSRPPSRRLGVHLDRGSGAGAAALWGSALASGCGGVMRWPPSPPGGFRWGPTWGAPPATGRCHPPRSGASSVGAASSRPGRAARNPATDRSTLQVPGGRVRGKARRPTILLVLGGRP